MIKIDTLDHYGRGIGKINNKIIFVDNALPGEIIEPIIVKEKKNYVEGYVKNYIKKSEKRIKEKCIYFNSCGGCDLLHLEYKNQLEFKMEKVKNIVSKYLNKNIKINEIIKSDNEFNYRNKITLKVNNKIGFFEKRSNNIVEINECKLALPIINNAIKYLKKLDLSHINSITLRTNSKDLMIIIEADKDIDINYIKPIAYSIYIKRNNVYNLVYGEKYLLEYVDNYKFLVSPDSFFQINLNVCAKLYKKIKDYTRYAHNILDLYCGTGTIGIYAHTNNNLLGVEVNKYAIKDANKNMKLNNITNAKFICGKSEEIINKIKFSPDVIIVDPPRGGMDKKAIRYILNSNASKVIYVSCDPMTLVRDLKMLSDNYKIIEITPFDMFPNTYHVENVCLMEKK